MTTEPSTTEQEGGGLSTGVVVAGVATGALLIATVVTGVVALGANSTFNDDVAASNDPMRSAADRAAARSDGLDAASRANTFATLNDVFLAATVVGAAVTTYFFLTQHGGSSTESARASAGDILVSPAAGRHGGGMVVRGTF